AGGVAGAAAAGVAGAGGAGACTTGAGSTAAGSVRVSPCTSAPCTSGAIWLSVLSATCAPGAVAPAGSRGRPPPTDPTRPSTTIRPAPHHRCDMEHPTAGEGNVRMVGTGKPGSSRSRAVGASEKRRSVPGFDLLDTLAKPGGSTVVVQEIPHEAGVSV